MPLPLIGGGWEGVFHASLTKPHSLFTLAIAKIPHPNPPLEGEGICLAILIIKLHSLVMASCFVNVYGYVSSIKSRLIQPMFYTSHS